MAHFIQPIVVAGSSRCCECQDGRATPGFLTNDIILTEINSATISPEFPCGPWSLIEDPGGDAVIRYGEITFGLSCGSSVALYITNNGFQPVTVMFYLDGALVETIPIELFGAVEAVIPFTGGPCGTLLTLVAFTDTESTGTELLVESITVS